MSIKIEKLVMDTYKTKYSDWGLYPHQVLMFDLFSKKENVLLVTKTGSGKTASVVLPLITNKESGVFVYPTNALLLDQVKSVKKIFLSHGKSFKEITPENFDENVKKQNEYEILSINGDILSEYVTRMGVKTKGEALANLLIRDNNKIVFINPDILYLILSLKFSNSGKILSYLQGYKTLLIDEFHLYRGVELSNIIFLLFLLKKLGVFSRYFFLSATPDENTKKILKKIFNIKVISSELPENLEPNSQKIVLYDVELTGIETKLKDIVSQTIDLLKTLKTEISELKTKYQNENQTGDYIPCVIIVDSVIDAIAIEDGLAEVGINLNEIASIRGLTDKNSRKTEGKTIAVGTSAIEVGIDFKTSILIFSATNASSFMQRFGRVGRHSEGKAYLLADALQIESLQVFGGTINRDTLENLAKVLYPYQRSLSWFLNTANGVVVVASIREQIFSQLSKDFENTNTQVKEFVNNSISEYLQIIEAEKYKSYLLKEKQEWFEAFVQNHSFRSSLSSVLVYDKDRKKSFFVDLKMFLKRANLIEYKNNQFIIDGFNKKNNKIRMNRETFPTNILFSTGDKRFDKSDFYFLVNDSFIEINDDLWEKHHLFIVLPRSVMKVADWTQTFFPISNNNDYVIAFDADALLLQELYRKYLE